MSYLTLSYIKFILISMLVAQKSIDLVDYQYLSVRDSIIF